MSFHKYDYLFKIITLGESNVGKRAFLERFTDNSIDRDGLHIRMKVIEVENKIVKLQIFDTDGEERFRTITKTYYNGAHGIILMYDVTDLCTFKNIKNWIKQVIDKGEKSMKKVLVGHKCDEHDRVVTEEEGKKLAEDYDIAFFESSAKTNKNVSEVFYYLVKEIIMEKERKQRKQREKKEESIRKINNFLMKYISF